MAKFLTDYHSITCGGREHFAVDGVIDIDASLLAFVADMIAAGDLVPVEDAAPETAAAEDKPRKGRK